VLTRKRILASVHNQASVTGYEKIIRLQARA